MRAWEQFLKKYLYASRYFKMRGFHYDKSFIAFILMIIFGYIAIRASPWCGSATNTISFPASLRAYQLMFTISLIYGDIIDTPTIWPGSPLSTIDAATRHAKGPVPRHSPPVQRQPAAFHAIIIDNRLKENSYTLTFKRKVGLSARRRLATTKKSNIALLYAL